MNVEVLVAAMGQTDFSLIEKMGISGAAVIANQADRFDFAEMPGRFGSCTRMITTPYRGLGRNRNTALMAARGDICVFADEDEVLANNYEVMVAQAFENVPDADMLVFNLETQGVITRPRRESTRVSRVRVWNALNYGSCRLAVRRGSLLKVNVWFSLLIGAGTSYGGGEDSLFAVECLRSGLKVYTYPKTIGFVTQTSSTWFTGYTEKYFRDKGVFYRLMSPTLWRGLCLQDAFRHRSLYEDEVPWARAYSLMLEGGRVFGSGDTDVQ